jgi:NADH-quinone oxidoreductase subunit C
MKERLKQLADHLAAALSAAVTGSEIRHRELSVRVERDALPEVLRFLRDDPKCRFTVLCDICGVDFPDRPLRFDVVYNLLSMSLNQRVRVKIETDENDPVPTATDLFNSAAFLPITASRGIRCARIFR